MITNYINSSIIIHRIEDEYNIQSHDYIAKFPNWVLNCLRDINVKQIYQLVSPTVEFENYKCKLPDNINRVYNVYVNEVKAKLDTKDTLKFIGSEYTMVSDFNGKVYGNIEVPDLVEEETVTPTPPSGNTILPPSVILANLQRSLSTCGQDGIVYRIENGWINTNVENGKIVIIGGAFPFQLDEDFQQVFPLIPDDENVINAIIAFTLKIILMRGYKHSLLSLEKNNEFVNPALMYNKFKARARNSCNSISADAKESLSKQIFRNII